MTRSPRDPLWACARLSLAYFYAHNARTARVGEETPLTSTMGPTRAASLPMPTATTTPMPPSTFLPADLLCDIIDAFASNGGGSEQEKEGSGKNKKKGSERVHGENGKERSASSDRAMVTGAQRWTNSRRCAGTFFGRARWLGMLPCAQADGSGRGAGAYVYTQHNSHPPIGGPSTLAQTLLKDAHARTQTSRTRI